MAAPMLLGLASCGQPAEAQPGPSLNTDGLVIITNSHANVPTPELSPGNLELVRAALDQGLPVEIVAVDGTPELVDLPPLRVEGNNPLSRARNLERAVAWVSMGITALPDSNEATSYEAFAVARNAAAAHGMQNPTIACLGCGLDSVGPLQMTAAGALRAAPSDYVDYLIGSNQLVNFGQSGFESVTVVLTATGATAPPQARLSQADSEHLTKIWRAVLEAGGADVVVDPYPLGGDTLETEFTVTEVALPEAPTMPAKPACTPQTVVFDGASNARFEYDVAVWMDEEAAREALRPLAEWLISGHNRTASIAGTTASSGTDDPDEGKELSLLRARAAADMLVSLGVNREQIVKLEGLGTHYPGRVPDLDAAGNPIPSERAKNRKVIITLLEAC